MTEPFELRAPQAPPVPVVVHVPHAALRIPDDVRADLVLDDAALARELGLMTDHRTDELWDGARRFGAAMFVNRLSRLVIDPERFRSDQGPANGMGPVYLRTSAGEPLRPDGFDPAELLERYFDPYGASFGAVIGDLLDRYGRAVIIDAHSYPLEPLPYEEASEARPEVCIGVDPDFTPDWLRDLAVGACHEHGYETAIDTPSAGAYVPPLQYEAGDDRVASVMIEIRRDTYLDGAGGGPGPDFGRVRALCDDLAERIATRPA